MYQLIDTNKPDLKIKVTKSAIEELSEGINPEFQAEKVMNAINRELNNIYMFDMFNINHLETIELVYPSKPQGSRTILRLNFKNPSTGQEEKMNDKPFHVKHLYTIPKNITLKVNNETKDNELVLTITI